MQCFKCQANNPDNAQFCMNCGKPFRRREARETPNTTREIYPHAAGQLAHTEMTRRKYSLSIKTLVVGLLISVVIGMFSSNLSNTGTLIIPGLGAVASFFALYYIQNVSESDYYKLPGSRDIGGEHRCIFCGHRGIWRQTPYKTNNTIASCSKCKNELFRE